MLRQQQSSDVVLPKAGKSAEQMCLPEDCVSHNKFFGFLLMYLLGS